MRSQSIPRVFSDVVALLGLMASVAACSSGADDDPQPVLPPADNADDPLATDTPAANTPGGSGAPVGTTGNGEVTAPVGTPLDPQAPPGSASDGDAPTMAGDIRFSEPSGTFEGSLSVAIESPIQGAVIRFT